MAANRGILAHHGHCVGSLRPIGTGRGGCTRRWWTSVRLFSLFLLYSPVLTVASSPLFSQPRPASDGLRALTVRHHDGRQGLLTDFLPPGLVVVNVWATYCEPCRKEIPALQTLSRVQEVPVFYLNVDQADRLREVRAMVSRFSIEKTTVLDRYQNALRFLKSDAVPVSLILHDGKIIYYSPGYDDTSIARLRSAIQLARSKERTR